MVSHICRILAHVLLAVIIVLVVDRARAQDYPTRPVRLVVGTAVGGPLDVPTRWIALKLADVFGKPVVLDFRGGAAGEIADEIVARAAPDGYTLLWITKSIAGIDMLHVPYKGGNFAINDVVAGGLDMIFFSMAGALPMIKTGKVVALGGAARERSQFLPELPSLHEQGVTGFDGGGRNGIVAPAKTPPAIVAKISGGLTKVLALPETRKAFGDAAIEATPSTPAELDAWIKSQSVRFRQVIKAANIQLN
jgi:tripartite-type tricarboxylate transporter receptor subunit TctC